MLGERGWERSKRRRFVDGVRKGMQVVGEAEDEKYAEERKMREQVICVGDSER